MELLRCQKPGAQRRVVVFLSQSVGGQLQRAVAPKWSIPLLRYRHNGVGGRTPQLLRALQYVSGGKLPICSRQKVLRCVDVFLNDHHSIPKLWFFIVIPAPAGS